jgi:hypothetical protein
VPLDVIPEAGASRVSVAGPGLFSVMETETGTLPEFRTSYGTGDPLSASGRFRFVGLKAKIAPDAVSRIGMTWEASFGAFVVTVN